MNKTRTLNKGEKIIITQGEYSDFGIVAFAICLKDFSPDDILREYLTIHPDQAKEYEFDETAFVRFLLIEKKVIEETSNMFEWHLGSYRNPSFYITKTKHISGEPKE